MANDVRHGYLQRMYCVTMAWTGPISLILAFISIDKTTLGNVCFETYQARRPRP